MNEVQAALLDALALKALPRAGWVRAGVPAPESVAAHSWGVAWLVLVLRPPEINLERALAMAILHDLAEIRTGDITPHDGVDGAEKHRLEREALESLLEALPSTLLELWEEFEEGATPEARFVRHCDKLDMGLQALRYQAETGLDLAEFLESAKKGAGEMMFG